MRFHGRKHTYYPLTDIQGTVWGYADSSNSIVVRWTYDAWGNVLSEVCTIPALATIRYRFQGREWSAATGLVYFRMRWYDPETGRWLSKDPIGLSGGLNLYAFCGNDAINYCDRVGLTGTATRERLEATLEKVQRGQQIALECACLGVKPGDTPTGKCGISEIANPVAGSSDPIIDDFKKRPWRKVQGVGAHIIAQIANVVDGFVLDKPGNFWNYWGMVEMWRHQQLIDEIREHL